VTCSAVCSTSTGELHERVFAPFTPSGVTGSWSRFGLSLRVTAINLRRLITMGLDHHDAGWVLA
jgi:hypothetical protein